MATSKYSRPEKIDWASYRYGIEAVALFFEDGWDNHVDHKSRMSDCIRLKFNIIKGRVRKNKKYGMVWRNGGWKKIPELK